MSHQETKHADRRLPCAWRVLALGVAALVLLYFFPIFRVVSLEEVRQKQAADQFDAVEFVSEFWTQSLMPRAEGAVHLPVLIASHSADAKDAAARFGNRLGVSTKAFYLVSVSGTITSLDDAIIEVAVDDMADQMVLIERGPVFGNTVRDASGLLNIGDFENTQQFNSISAQLNLVVEQQVLPPFANSAQVGQQVKLVGGIELADGSPAPKTLYLTPVFTETVAP